MVREEWICAGRVSQEDVGAGGQDPARAWVCFAALGGADADDEATAAFAGLAAGGIGFASDGVGILKPPAPIVIAEPKQRRKKSENFPQWLKPTVLNSECRS